MKAILLQCEQCAHCVELYTPRDSDSNELKQARLKIERSFGKWIHDHYLKNAN